MTSYRRTFQALALAATGLATASHARTGDIKITPQEAVMQGESLLAYVGVKDAKCAHFETNQKIQMLKCSAKNDITPGKSSEVNLKLTVRELPHLKQEVDAGDKIAADTWQQNFTQD